MSPRVRTQHGEVTAELAWSGSGSRSENTPAVGRTGWQRKLDPDYDIMNTLQTLLLKEDWAKSLTYTIERLMAP
ncbi:hypothetical protein HanOQP8_Chr05g0171671 [Helianthus annuus]|nr:hypothetical protein HanOQP8_Chr05g0171671 [Helianthus annuus]